MWCIHSTVTFKCFYSYQSFDMMWPKTCQFNVIFILYLASRFHLFIFLSVLIITNTYLSCNVLSHTTSILNYLTNPFCWGRGGGFTQLYFFFFFFFFLLISSTDLIQCLIFIWSQLLQCAIPFSYIQLNFCDYAIFWYKVATRLLWCEFSYKSLCILLSLDL